MKNEKINGRKMKINKNKKLIKKINWKNEWKWKKKQMKMIVKWMQMKIYNEWIYNELKLIILYEDPPTNVLDKTLNNLIVRIL